MMKNYRFILLMPFFLIGGCSSGEDQAAPDKSSKENFLKDQTRALEKAKQVESVIQSGADKRRQAIEEQSK
jgi:PBP1b-binding outer membrane lipoprotein LpoB